MFILPKKGLKLENCKFYHSIPLPDGEIIQGDWDLTKCINQYLGNMNYMNQKVIDVGAGSGFLSFTMEKQGADVVSYDMPDGSYWDVLKYPGYKPAVHTEVHEMYYNAYDYIHEKINSKCKQYRANIYQDLPEELGDFDAAIFGTMLSHVRDPMLVLMNILYKVKSFAVLINPFVDRHFNGSTFYPSKNQFRRVWWNIDYSTIERMVNSIGWYISNSYDVYPVQNIGMEKPTPRKYRSLVIKRYN